MPVKPLASFKSFIFLTLCFAICWSLYELSSTDLLLQDKLYNFQTSHWLIDRDSPILRLIFYKGIKWVLAFLGITALGLFIASFFKEKFKTLRYESFYFFLCMALIPLSISSLKSVTNVYCPWNLARYGGEAPYVKVYNHYPETFKQTGSKPQCFPGGHASGGFALFSLFFLARSRRQRILSLFPPLLIGGIMGTYQMLNGAHFFGHNLTTAFLAFLMAQGIYILLFSLLSKKKKLT